MTKLSEEILNNARRKIKDTEDKIVKNIKKIRTEAIGKISEQNKNNS